MHRFQPVNLKGMRCLKEGFSEKEMRLGEGGKEERGRGRQTDGNNFVSDKFVKRMTGVQMRQVSVS